MPYSKLGRPSNQRKALMRDLITDLIINEQIETTLPKAKALQKLADQMVTLGKKGDLAARRRAAEMVRFERVIEVAEDGTQTKGEYAIQKLFGTIAPKYVDRKGGYTQVLKTGPRRGDAAPMAIIKFVE